MSPSIILSLLLCIFQLFYLLVLGVDSPFAFSCILMFALIYIFFMALSPSSKPENTVYVYLLFFILIPKSSYSVPGLLTVDTLNGINLFKILEAISVLAISIASVARRDISREIRTAKKAFLRLNGVLIAMLIVSLISSIMTAMYYNTEPLNLVYFNLLNGVVFLYGCFCFITDIKSIEKIFMILVLAGVELFLEVFAFIYIKIPIPTNAMFDITGRFSSLVYTDCLAVGVMSIVSLSAVLYFIHTRKKKIFWILVPFLFLPVFHGHERAPMGGMLLVICTYILLAARRTPKMITSLALVLCALIAVQLDITGSMIGRFLGGDIKETEYFSSGGLLGRYANYARGLDVVFHSFPFGIGPGNLPEFMSISEVKSNFNLYQIEPSAARNYHDLMSGYYITQAHNLYINFVAEYGLLGIIAIALYFCHILGSYKALRKAKQKNPDVCKSCQNVAEIAVFGMLVGLGFFYLFQSNPVFYFVFSLIFYVSYAVPKMNTEVTILDRPHHLPCVAVPYSGR